MGFLFFFHLVAMLSCIQYIYMDTSTNKVPFIKRPSTWIGLVVIAIIAVLAAFLGLRAYAAYENSQADEAFEAASTGTAVEDLDGTWLIAEGSQAGYRVGKVQAGQDVIVTARTTDVTGDITITNDSLDAGSTVQVDLRTVASDSAMRDNEFRNNILETDTYPYATFTTTEAVDISSLKDNGIATVSVPGTLEIHGVTQDVTINMNLSHNDGIVNVVGNSTLTWTDFNVTPPNSPASVVDQTGDIEFSLNLEHS